MKDDVIKRALARFDTAESAESENREEAIEDLRFRLGEQWPEDIRDERESDGQACLVINRVPQFVRQVVNEMRQMRPQIKVRGVDSQADPNTAEMLTGMVRAIEADSTADSAYDTAGEYAATCGIGYWRVTTEYETDESFDQVIKIERVQNPFSVLLDQAATNQDGSDARYGFVVETLTRDEFEARYPNAKMVADWPDLSGTTASDWVSKDSCRVVEYWEVEEEAKTLYQLADGSTTTELPEGMSEEDLVPLNGMFVPLVVAKRQTVEREVYQYVLTATEVLEKTEWLGRYIPIVRVVGEELVVDGKVERRGMVRDMRDPQRAYNYARSQFVDRVSLAPKAPFVGAEGMFQNPNWKRANKANLAYLEYAPQGQHPPPRREPGPDASPGLIAEIQMTAEELRSVTGIYNAGLGDRSNEVSGVAIDSRKLESDVGNYHYLDNLAKAIRYTGKILVDLIPKIYSGARMVRILKPGGEEERVQINQPFQDQQGRQQHYNLTSGRYDVAVDVGPSYTTQRQEAVSSMLEIAKAFPQSVQVMGDLIAKNMDWPEADEIAKRLKLLLPPEILQSEFPVIGQMQKQMQSMQEQAATMVQGLQHQIAQLQLELQKRDQELSIKVAELAEDRRQADLKHTEGMTKLELEALRDLGKAGAAYG